MYHYTDIMIVPSLVIMGLICILCGVKPKNVESDNVLIMCCVSLKNLSMTGKKVILWKLIKL